jgi:hypothetical protein
MNNKYLFVILLLLSACSKHVSETSQPESQESQQDEQTGTADAQYVGGPLNGLPIARDRSGNYRDIQGNPVSANQAQANYDRQRELDHATVCDDCYRRAQLQCDNARNSNSVVAAGLCEGYTRGCAERCP